MKYKAPLATPVIKDIERFAKKYKVAINGCWEWNGYIDSCGYGRFGYMGSSRLAHRFMLSIFEQLDNMLEIDHLCRNRKCVNPKHLEQVSGEENYRRGEQRQFNLSKTHCPRGHEYNAINTRIRKKDGARECRSCDRLRPSRYKRKEN